MLFPPGPGPGAPQGAGGSRGQELMGGGDSSARRLRGSKARGGGGCALPGWVLPREWHPIKAFHTRPTFDLLQGKFDRPRFSEEEAEFRRGCGPCLGS